MPDKPDHVPPHDRFFEDGEEPPERYDLQDELDYILPDNYDVDESRWFRIAARYFRSDWSQFVSDMAVYLCALALVGICSGGLLSLLLEPLLRFRLKSHYLCLLAGKQDQLPTAAAAWRQSARLVGSQLPAFVCWILTALAVSFADSWLLASTMAEWRSVGVLAIALGMGAVSFFVHVRLCGFSFELAFDHGLDVVQGLRGSWRLTRPHAGRLICLKLRLWFMILCAGAATLGFGLLFAVPYASLVWTAAYLDMAGSVPLVDLNSVETAESTS